MGCDIMAKPIAPTPTLYGEDAEAFIKDMERIDRGEFTEKELEVRKKVKKIYEENYSKL